MSDEFNDVFVGYYKQELNKRPHERDEDDDCSDEDDCKTGRWEVRRE